MANPAAVQPQLPASLKVLPRLRVKPVVESDLSSPADDPLPVQIVNSELPYTVQEILDVHHRGRDYQYLVD